MEADSRMRQTEGCHKMNRLNKPEEKLSLPKKTFEGYGRMG
jgi:hypothetical protein